jgi:hypothetical protein
MQNEKQSNWKKWIFRLSITLNIIFALGWGLNYLNSPTYRLGVLTQDVNAGFLAGDSTIYRIPKGITVRDISPRGISAIGQFENNRFELIFTTDRQDLINYDLPKDSMFQFGNYYSADRISGIAR